GIVEPARARLHQAERRLRLRDTLEARRARLQPTSETHGAALAIRREPALERREQLADLAAARTHARQHHAAVLEDLGVELPDRHVLCPEAPILGLLEVSDDDLADAILGRAEHPLRILADTPANLLQHEALARIGALVALDHAQRHLGGDLRAVEAPYAS